jgi:hypothetical protein
VRRFNDRFVIVVLGVALGGVSDRRGLGAAVPPGSAGEKPAYALVLGDAKRVHDELTY